MQNLLPNTQWQIATGIRSDTKMNRQGTGTTLPCQIMSYTTGLNMVVFQLDPNYPAACMDDVEQDDLFVIDGGGTEAGDLAVPGVMRLAPYRVAAVDRVAKTVTAGLPFGAKPATCAAPATYMRFRPYNIGMMASNDTTETFDGWRKRTESWVWRDQYPENVKSGSRYSAGIKKKSAYHEPFWYEVPWRDLDRFRGRTIVIGGWAYHKVRNAGGEGTWHVCVNVQTAPGGVMPPPPPDPRTPPPSPETNPPGDPPPPTGPGMPTAYSTAAGSGGWEWKEVSCAIPADCTGLQIGYWLLGAPEDTYYFSQPMCGYGSALGVGNYEPRLDEVIYALNHVPARPSHWINATLDFPVVADQEGSPGGSPTYGFAVRPYPEFHGKIAPTVRMMNAQFEGRADHFYKVGAMKAQGLARAWNGNASVSGCGGTHFVDEVRMNEASGRTYAIRPVGTGQWYDVASVTNDGLLTLASPFAGATTPDTGVEWEVNHDYGWGTDCIVMRSDRVDPAVFGFTRYVQAPTGSQCAEGLVQLGAYGDLWLSSGIPGSHWYNVSLDVNGFNL